MKYVLSLDQGTTSSRAIIFDELGEIVAMAQEEFSQSYPNPGWVEHDPEEIWRTQSSVLSAAMEKGSIASDNVAAIGITNQRETTVIWDRRTGIPIAPAIVWQDRRTSDRCQQLKSDGLLETIRLKTGLTLDPYFSATKIQYLLECVPGARDRARDGQLAFGTIDSWLLWKLTQGRVHATDTTNASRTMLFNLAERRWDEELLALFGIPKAILPEVKESRSFFGEAVGLLSGVPILGVAGDQHAALFGQVCAKEGMVKNTYGTGCFILMNIGSSSSISKHGLLTTLACGVAGTEYAIEGSVFSGGSTISWLRDSLGIIRTAEEVEALAASVPSTNGVAIVPAFSGLGAPIWDAKARGLICGLTAGANKAHIARAALEAIALQTYDVVKAMEGDSGFSLVELRVDGGASKNNLLMQIQADLLGIRVVRPKVTEITALGVAFLAGLESGIWRGIDDLNAVWKFDRSFEPLIKSAERELILERWYEAIHRARCSIQK